VNIFDMDNPGKRTVIKKWSMELRPDVFKLSNHDDDVVKIIFGPPKQFAKTMDKMMDGKSLKDSNRFTFEFEDPYVMALICRFLVEGT